MAAQYGTRWRILLAGLGMIVWITVYSILAVTVVGWLEAPGVVEGLLYAVLGIAWIFPVIRIFTWASKEDRAG